MARSGNGGPLGKLPLVGKRVLDLTRLLPGAYCTLLLADLGADVVKVEAPGEGDYLRWTPPLSDGQSVIFNALNRNKRSLTLDLKRDPGGELFLRLAEAADVVVEGNRPGVMERLQVGWEALHARNPKLVLCSITGYGQEGEQAHVAGHDLNYMALAGALSLNGAPGGPPLPYGLQVADFAGGGLGAALAVLAALLEVAAGQEGRHLDVSMTAGVLAWLAPQFAALEVEGHDPERGRQPLTGGYPCYRIYRCRDGGYYSVAALEPKFWHAFCDAAARPDLVPLQHDPRPEAHAAVERLFESRTRSEWQQALDGVDVCCEPVLSLSEAARRPPASERLRQEKTGREVAPQLPLGPGWRRRPPPRLGEHNAQLFAEVGVTESQLARLSESGVI